MIRAVQRRRTSPERCTPPHRDVWRACTDAYTPAVVGPEKTVIPECELDPARRAIYIVTEAGGHGEVPGHPLPMSDHLVFRSTAACYDSRSGPRARTTARPRHVNDDVSRPTAAPTRAHISINGRTQARGGVRVNWG